MHRLTSSCDLNHPKDRVDSVIRAFHARPSSRLLQLSRHYPLIGLLSLKLFRLNCSEGTITSSQAGSGQGSRNMVKKEAGMSLMNWTCCRARSALETGFRSRKRRGRSRLRRVALEDGQMGLLCSGVSADCKLSCEAMVAGRVVS